jgi:hypothetical protein
VARLQGVETKTALDQNLCVGLVWKRGQRTVFRSISLRIKRGTRRSGAAIGHDRSTDGRPDLEGGWTNGEPSRRHTQSDLSLLVYYALLAQFTLRVAVIFGIVQITEF